MTYACHERVLPVGSWEVGRRGRLPRDGGGRGSRVGLGRCGSPQLGTVFSAPRVDGSVLWQWGGGGGRLEEILVCFILSTLILNNGARPLKQQHLVLGIIT